MIGLALALPGAVLFRIRGGWLPTGHTQVARAIWCVPTGVLVALLAHSWLAGLATVLFAFAGLLLPNSPWQNGETWQHMSTQWHWLKAVGVGVLRITLLLLPAAWALDQFGLLAWGAAGALNAPFYWLAWRLPMRALGGFIDAPTAWGEALFGALAWGLLGGLLL